MQFFKTIQNKMHWAAHGHTAAEIIYQRADAEKQNMGLHPILRATYRQNRKLKLLKIT